MDTKTIINSPSILPFRWLRPEGVREQWDQFAPLLQAYRAASLDLLTIDELGAELSATIRNESGAVFVALDDKRALAGYLCVRLMMSTGQQQDAMITQWYKWPDPPETAMLITDAFFGLAREFALANRCAKIKLETRAVRDDGSLPQGFRRMLDRFGFRPAYLGLEAVINHAA